MMMLTLVLPSMLAFVPDIQPVKTQAPPPAIVKICPDGSVSPGGYISSADNVTYVLTRDISCDQWGIWIEKNDTLLDGAGHTVTGSMGEINVGISIAIDSPYRAVRNVTVKNTEITNCRYGFFVAFDASNSTIVGNNVTANNYGVFLEGYDNVVKENNIDHNSFGVVVTGGGVIHHNNFMYNPTQVSPLGGGGVWDNGYPSGGNYWSDYAGVDKDSDGIGDTPYIIDSSRKDRWPLMNPVSTAQTSDSEKPVSNAGSDQTVNEDALVSFDGSASTDNVGIVSYDWSFGDGTTGTGKTTSHAYASPGSYTVTLTVMDAAGNSAVDSLSVTVNSEGNVLPNSTDGFPMWIVGAVVAIVVVGAAMALLWRRQKGLARQARR